MGKRVFWVVFLLLVAPLAAVGIMASPLGFLGALVYTKARNAMAEAVLAVTVEARLDGRSLVLRRVVRCEGGSTDADDGAKLRFTARPGYLVEDVGGGETLVLPVHGLCRAAVKAEWSFPRWSYTLRPRPDFVPLAMVVGADGVVTAQVQAAAPAGRLALAPPAVAAADRGASSQQPLLPAALVGTEFHYAMMTPVPADLLAYYPVLAAVAGQGPGLVPVEVLPPDLAFATFRFPAEAEKLTAWADAGRVATPLQQHALPTLIGLRRAGDRLEAAAGPGVLTLDPRPLTGVSGSIGGVAVGFEAGTPWRRLLIDGAGVPSLLDFKTARLPAE